VSDGIEKAQAELNRKVLGKKGIAGTAIGLHSGKPCLKVYLESGDAHAPVPKRVGGFPVITETTGRFRRH
jgi:hypothetical protein